LSGQGSLKTEGVIVRPVEFRELGRVMSLPSGSSGSCGVMVYSWTTQRSQV